MIVELRHCKSGRKTVREDQLAWCVQGFASFTGIMKPAMALLQQAAVVSLHVVCVSPCA